jgi:AcrR family transcriptional regulator
MTPGKKTKGTRRKDDVLAAAAELFANRGFAAVGIDDIGERIGITGPAVYNHFASKEDILAAVILDASERMAQVAETAATQRSGNPREDLRNMLTLTTNAALDLGDASLVHLREARWLRAPDAQHVQDTNRRLLEITRRLVTTVVPDISVSSFGLRSAFAMGVNATVARDRAPTRDPLLAKTLADATMAVFETPAMDTNVQDRASQPGNARAPWVHLTRREELLDIATRLFAERGYHAVSMDDIGAAAGISAAAIYRHFSNKAEIADEAFIRLGTRIVVGMELALRQAATPGEALEGIVRAFVLEALEAGDLLSVLTQTLEELEAENADRDHGSRQQMLDMLTHVLKHARPGLRRAKAKLLARSAIAGITVAAQIFRDKRTGPELAAIALAVLHS